MGILHQRRVTVRPRKSGKRQQKSKKKNLKTVIAMKIEKLVRIATCPLVIEEKEKFPLQNLIGGKEGEIVMTEVLQGGMKERDMKGLQVKRGAVGIEETPLI